MRVLNGRVRLEDARPSVWGRGSDGKGGVGVRFSFSDVLAILVQFMLFLLMAA